MSFGILFLLTCACLPARPAKAAEKAVYTIKKHKTVKYYAIKNKKKKLKVTYRFDQPVLKGNSPAVAKINKSLRKKYKKSWRDRDKVFSTAEGMVRQGYGYAYPFYSTDTCKVTYNKGGIVCFKYHREWYAGGTGNVYNYGYSYDLHTGKLLTLKDVISGSASRIKEKIWQKYKKYCPDDRNAILKSRLSDWYFYLKDGDVIVSSGSYLPGGGKGEMPVTLPGAY